VNDDYQARVDAGCAQLVDGGQGLGDEGRRRIFGDAFATKLATRSATERVSLAYTVDSQWRNRSEIFQGRPKIVYHDDSGNWFRAYGNENWEFDENGLMRRRHASINDLPIRESERKFHWDRSRPRPADHPGLTDLGL
jgi:nuclear transport factor 2 (NTF2) superfamily protein